MPFPEKRGDYPVEKPLSQETPGSRLLRNAVLTNQGNIHYTAKKHWKTGWETKKSTKKSLFLRNFPGVQFKKTQSGRLTKKSVKTNC